MHYHVISSTLNALADSGTPAIDHCHEVFLKSCRLPFGVGLVVSGSVVLLSMLEVNAYSTDHLLWFRHSCDRHCL
jgi:hypothetical protein